MNTLHLVDLIISVPRILWVCKFEISRGELALSLIPHLKPQKIRKSQKVAFCNGIPEIPEKMPGYGGGIWKGNYHWRCIGSMEMGRFERDLPWNSRWPSFVMIMSRVGPNQPTGYALQQKKTQGQSKQLSLHCLWVLRRWLARLSHSPILVV